MILKLSLSSLSPLSPALPQQVEGPAPLRRICSAVDADSIGGAPPMVAKGQNIFQVFKLNKSLNRYKL